VTSLVGENMLNELLGWAYSDRDMPYMWLVTIKLCGIAVNELIHAGVPRRRRSMSEGIALVLVLLVACDGPMFLAMILYEQGGGWMVGSLICTVFVTIAWLRQPATWPLRTQLASVVCLFYGMGDIDISANLFYNEMVRGHVGIVCQNMLVQPHPFNHNQLLFGFARLIAGWDAARGSASFLGASTFALAASARTINAPQSHDITPFELLVECSYELPALFLITWSFLGMLPYGKPLGRTTLS
jgi:hypothetical protein